MSTFPRHMLIAFLSFAPAMTCLAAESENTAEKREGLVAMKKYAEALALYKEALAKDPDNPALLFNAGLLAYLTKDPAQAVTHWTRLKAVDTEDWRVRAKLIQAYEALGKQKERDVERAELIKLRKETEDEKLKAQKFYCRDQFTVGETAVMVFEYFELEGDWPVRFSFNVLEADGRTINARYSLGSYKTTNDIARETGRIKADERLFHLDAYKERGAVHETHGFYVGEPAYDAVKKRVAEILERKAKPPASSTEQKP